MAKSNGTGGPNSLVKFQSRRQNVCEPQSESLRLLVRHQLEMHVVATRRLMAEPDVHLVEMVEGAGEVAEHVVGAAGPADEGEADLVVLAVGPVEDLQGVIFVGY